MDAFLSYNNIITEMFIVFRIVADIDLSIYTCDGIRFHFIYGMGRLHRAKE